MLYTEKIQKNTKREKKIKSRYTHILTANWYNDYHIAVGQ